MLNFRSHIAVGVALAYNRCVINLKVSVIFQALDTALKVLKSNNSSKPAMLISVDRNSGKVLCLCNVPKVSIIQKFTFTQFLA